MKFSSFISPNRCGKRSRTLHIGEDNSKQANGKDRRERGRDEEYELASLLKTP